jgi:hypothetical protein
LVSLSTIETTGVALSVVLSILAAVLPGEVEARTIQRTGGADDDGRTDAAFLLHGVGGLVDLGAADQFGSQNVEAELAAAVLGGQQAVVQQHGVELGTKAPDRDELAFAAAAVDRDTGDALQRFGDVLVREFADVLGGDGVDDADLGALQVQSLGEAGPGAGDDDFFNRRAVIGLRGGRGLGQDRRCEEQGESAGAAQQQAAGAAIGLCHFSPQRLRVFIVTHMFVVVR